MLLFVVVLCFRSIATMHLGSLLRPRATEVHLCPIHQPTEAGRHHAWTLRPLRDYCDLGRHATMTEMSKLQKKKQWASYLAASRVMRDGWSDWTRGYLWLRGRIAEQPYFAGIVGCDQKLLFPVFADAVDVRAVKVLRPYSNRLEAHRARLGGPFEVLHRTLGCYLAAERWVPCRKINKVVNATNMNFRKEKFRLFYLQYSSS